MEQDKNEGIQLTRAEEAPLLEVGLDPAEWFTTRTLSNYWGVKRKVIANAGRAGKLPYTKYGKRAYFSKATALVGWRPFAIKKRERALGTELTPSSRGIELLVKIEENYLIALADNVTYEDWVFIVRTAVEAAKKGDWRSRKWIADYLLGTPVHRVAAEVDLSSRKDYSDDQRAAAVTALLELVRSRGEDEVIDVAGTPVVDGEESS